MARRKAVPNGAPPPESGLRVYWSNRFTVLDMFLKTTQPTTKLIEYSRLFDTRGYKNYLTFVSVQRTKPKFSLQVTVDRSIVEIEAENVLKTQNC